MAKNTTPKKTTKKSAAKAATANVPAKVEEVKVPKITAKTKFPKDSVENVTLKDIKARERKIDKAQRSLVALWIAQGKELNEFIAITGVSQRLAAELTGVKRTMVNTYCTIAADPRMLNEDFQDALEQFSQKELIALSKLDDEEAFDKALEDGELPKADKPHPITDVEAEPTEAPRWKTDMQDIIANSSDFYAAKEAMLTYLETDDEDDIEAIIEESGELNEEEQLLADAIAKCAFEDIGEQATDMKLKKSVLKTAINDGIMSATTVKKLTAYVAA